jgi:hypothetical protein
MLKTKVYLVYLLTTWFTYLEITSPRCSFQHRALILMWTGPGPDDDGNTAGWVLPDTR